MSLRESRVGGASCPAGVSVIRGETPRLRDFFLTPRNDKTTRVLLGVLSIILLFALVILGKLSSLYAEDSAKESFGRTCLVVEEEKASETGVFQTALFDENSQPGPGRRLSLYLDSSVDTYALVALFNRKDQKLVGGWLPELVKLEAWEESRLPEESVNWDWSESGDDFEIHVVFMAESHKDFGALKSLIDSMVQSGEVRELLGLQTVRLREIIDRITSEKEAIRYKPGATPPAWGGTLRGLEFHWRQNSQKIALDEQGYGSIIYPVSPADHY